jgi:hypothetical protein
MRFVCFTTAAIALVLLLPASASAKVSTLRIDEVPLAGPILAGEGVLWIERSSAGGVRVMRARPGEGVKVLEELPPEGTGSQPYLAASTSRAIFSNQIFVRSPLSGSTVGGPREVRTGGLDGPFDRLVRCSDEGTFGERHRSVDVDGEVVAYRDCGTSGGVIRDMSPTPMLPERRVTDRAQRLRLAGRYAAWVVGDERVDVVVYDRLLDTEVYRLTAAMIPGAVRGLDVQNDGTVAFSYVEESPRVMRVAWASLADPTVHQLPLTPKLSYDVKLSGGRLAFHRGTAGDFDVPFGEVGLTDLQGNSRVLARPAQDHIYREHFDFDGVQIAWLFVGCSSATIHIQGIDDPPELLRPRSGCPLRFARQPSVRRDGRIRLSPDCRLFYENDCFISRIEIRTSRKVRAPGSSRRRRIALAAGRSVNGRPPRLRLSREGRALLRAHGAVKARITAVLRDQGRRKETRVATVRLKRP